MRSSAISPEDAPAVTSALQAFAFRTDQGDAAAAASDLGTLAERLIAAARHLLHGPVENRALIAECRPWIEAFEVGAIALRHVATLALERRLEQDGPAELRPYLVRLRQARVRVFGDVLDMALADLTHTNVRPGEAHPGSRRRPLTVGSRGVNNVSVRWGFASDRTGDTRRP